MWKNKKEEAAESYKKELVGRIGELLKPYVKYHLEPTYPVDGSPGPSSGGVVTLFLNDELNLPGTKIFKLDLTSLPKKFKKSSVDLDVLERSYSTEKSYILHTIKFELDKDDQMKFKGVKLENGRDPIMLLEDLKKGLECLPTVPYGTDFFVRQALESSVTPIV